MDKSKGQIYRDSMITVILWFSEIIVDFFVWVLQNQNQVLLNNNLFITRNKGAKEYDVKEY